MKNVCCAVAALAPAPGCSLQPIIQSMISDNKAAGNQTPRRRFSQTHNPESASVTVYKRTPCLISLLPLLIRPVVKEE